MRTFLLCLLVTCALPAAAVAAPMPAGTYDVALTGGTLKLGAGLLPSLPIGSSGSAPFTIGTSPQTATFPFVVPDTPISGSAAGAAFTGTMTVNASAVTLNVNPADGSATLDAPVFVWVSVSTTILGSSQSGRCDFGTAAAPISLHVSTVDGSAWDASTNAFTLVDKTFAMPNPSCSNPLLNSVIGFVTGDTSGGNNNLTMSGTATRRPDPAPTTPPPAGGGGDQTPTVTPINTGGVLPTGETTCLVPNVVGKKLAAAKKALKAAGCKVGKVKSKKTTKKARKKKGRVVAQDKKAGTRVAAGTAVKLTVLSAPKKTRKR